MSDPTLHTPRPDSPSWRLFIYVQAFLAIIMVVSVIGFYAWFKWVPGELVAMASMAFGFYFGKATGSAGVTRKP